jgi:hypothetical protein
LEFDGQGRIFAYDAVSSGDYWNESKTPKFRQ